MKQVIRTRGQRRRQQVASPTGPAPVEAVQYLTFVVCQEVFAIAILGIKEITEYMVPTEVPMTPGWIRGVINLRGAAVPVIDPAVRFGKPASAITKRTCIIIVEVALGGRRQDVGLIVEAVNAVLEISAAEIEPAPAFGAKISADFVLSVARVAGRFVIILDVDRVAASDALAAMAEGDRPAGV